MTTNTTFTPEMLRNLLRLQQEERNGQVIYQRLAGIIKDEHNRKVLECIAGEEQKHYNIWKKHTQRDVPLESLQDDLFFWGWHACLG